MPFTNIYQPSQVTILRIALDQHCQAHGVIDLHGRASVVLRLMDLFNNGVTTVEALRAGLDAGRSRAPVPDTDKNHYERR